jgi:integrase
MGTSAHYFSAPANLKAVKVDSLKRVIRKGSTTKPRWWRVNLGKKVTGTCKQRRFFPSQKDAKRFIDDVEIAARKNGQSAFNIPQPLAIEAIALTEQLVPCGASLTDAVKLFLRHNAATTGRTVDKLIPEYLQTKANPEYKRDQEISLGVFAREFGERPIATILSSEIDKWLTSKNWKPLNLRNRIRDYSMLFKWAKLHGHISENPFDKIRRPKVPRVTPAIFTVRETRLILEAALSHPELGLLPMMAVCFFSGVRIAEVQRMRWENIDWSENEIRLPGPITKTGSPRNIEIFDALRAWIGEKPPRQGDIVSPAHLRNRRCELLSFAGVATKRNALRHSFASYHAAKYRDPGKLQILLGQETPSILFKHYIAATKGSDGRAFFDLRPTAEVSHVF